MQSRCYAEPVAPTLHTDSSHRCFAPMLGTGVSPGGGGAVGVMPMVLCRWRRRDAAVLVEPERDDVVSASAAVRWWWVFGAATLCSLRRGFLDCGDGRVTLHFHFHFHRQPPTATAEAGDPANQSPGHPAPPAYRADQPCKPAVAKTAGDHSSRKQFAKKVREDGSRQQLARTVRWGLRRRGDRPAIRLQPPGTMRWNM